MLKFQKKPTKNAWYFSKEKGNNEKNFKRLK